MPNHADNAVALPIHGLQLPERQTILPAEK